MARAEPSTMPALARVPLPAPGEHASGYLRRLADENGLLLRDFRSLLALRTIAPRSLPDAWGRLAAGLGVPIETFDAMRWRPVEGAASKWLSFLGHEIHESFLHLASPQFCRLCLSSNNIVRSAWSLRHLTACHIHHIELSNACPCCDRTIRLTKSLSSWTCSQCGSDFRFGKTKPASLDQLAISEWIETRLALADSTLPKASDIPLNPRTATLHEMLTTLLYLGMLSQNATSDRQARRVRACHLHLFADFHTSPDEIREQNRLALELLSNWPTSFFGILEGLVDKYPSPPSAPPLLQRFGSEAGIFATRALKDRHGETLPFVTTARREFLQVRIGYRPRARVPKRKGILGTAPAYWDGTNLLAEEATRQRLTSKGRSSLRPFLEIGKLTPLRTERGGLAFDADEVEKINSALASLPNPPTGRSDLLAAPACVQRLAHHAGAMSAFLKSILDHEVEAYSTGGRLDEVWVPEAVFLETQALSALRSWISQAQYRDIHQISGRTTRLWGPMAKYSIPQANQLVASGGLRFKRVNYDQGGDPRRYYVADLVRDVQSWLGPFLIDVDSLEPPIASIS
jgi:ribosomal protein L37AE/L43A